MKDPAFLFYSKDWLEGTADLSPQEKGVFADLLAYHHQRGILPKDKKKLARLSRVSEKEFDEIWESIKYKFEETEDGYINNKLVKVVRDRQEKSRKNKLIATFGYVINKLDISKEEKKKIKNRFDVYELLKQDTEWNTERMTEWCNSILDETPQEKDYPEDVYKIYDWILEQDLFEKNYLPDTESKKDGWLDTINKLIYLDGKDRKEICKVIKWAKNDDFWYDKFRSVKKLRQKDKQDTKYYDVFLVQMNSKSKKDQYVKSNPTSRKL